MTTQTLEYWHSLLQAGAPIWILLIGALLCLFLDVFNFKRTLEVVFVGGVLTLLASLWAALCQWQTLERLTFDLILMDRVSLYFIILVIFVGILSLFSSYSYLRVMGTGESQILPKINPHSPYTHLLKKIPLLPGAFVSLLLFCILGQIFLFASDNLIVNFLGLETLSLSLYILVGANRRDLRSTEAAIKYFVMGSVASAILLYGIALFYGSFDTFQLTLMSQVPLLTTQAAIPKIALGMILIGLFFKVSVVPFHQWAPDAYEGAPTPITGFMATGVKAAAFGLLYRVLSALHFISPQVLHQILAGCVVLTLLVGNCGALMQKNIKRLLAYSSIAHAGFILLGLMVGFKSGRGFDPKAVSAVLYYLFGYSLMTLGAFAVLSAMVEKNKEVTNLADLAGLSKKHPFLAGALTLFLLSMLGIPPTVGFTAKYGILSYAVAEGQVGLAVFGVIMSLVSAYYYLLPIVTMYFHKVDEKRDSLELPFPLVLSTTLCAVGVLCLGLSPTFYLRMAETAVSFFK